MSNREIFNTTKVENCVLAQTLTTTTNGSSVDMSDANAVTFIVNMGDSADTLSGSVLWTITLEESSDDSIFTTVTDAESLLIAIDGTKQALATSIVVDAPAEDSKVFEIAYKVPSSSQYLRPVITATGTHTNGTPMSVIAVKGVLKVSPESGKADA